MNLFVIYFSCSVDCCRKHRSSELCSKLQQQILAEKVSKEEQQMAVEESEKLKKSNAQIEIENERDRLTEEQLRMLGKFLSLFGFSFTGINLFCSLTFGLKLKNI